MPGHGKVVNLVVEDNACRATSNHGAKFSIDGGRERDSIALCVKNAQMGSAVVIDSADSRLNTLGVKVIVRRMRLQGIQSFAQTRGCRFVHHVVADVNCCFRHKVRIS